MDLWVHLCALRIDQCKNCQTKSKDKTSNLKNQKTKKKKKSKKGRKTCGFSLTNLFAKSMTLLTTCCKVASLDKKTKTKTVKWQWLKQAKKIWQQNSLDNQFHNSGLNSVNVHKVIIVKSWSAQWWAAAILSFDNSAPKCVFFSTHKSTILWFCFWQVTHQVASSLGGKSKSLYTRSSIPMMPLIGCLTSCSR